MRRYRGRLLLTRVLFHIGFVLALPFLFLNAVSSRSREFLNGR